jgi:hypothetical protein
VVLLAKFRIISFIEVHGQSNFAHDTSTMPVCFN